MDLTFRDKDRIIKKFAKEYMKSKIIEHRGLELFNDVVKEPEICYSSTPNEHLYYYSLQTKIDNVLDILDWESASFLKNEFFDSRHKTNWWMNYYSRSTYYRVKKKAMESFLGLLYA